MARPILTDNLPRLINELNNRIAHLENRPALLGHTILAEQFHFGSGTTQSIVAATGTTIYATTGTSTPLSISYTPAINVYWEVEMHLSQVDRTTTAGWAYFQSWLNLSGNASIASGGIPAFATGLIAYDLDTNYGTGGPLYSVSHPKTTLALEKDKTYTITATGYQSAGGANVYQGPAYMKMMGKAWGR